VYCWGREYTGGHPLYFDQFTAKRVRALAGVSDLATNGNDTCVVRSGRVLCRGDGGFGQLGNHATEDSTRFVAVRGITTAVAVSMGGRTTCALLKGGSVLCWGRGAQGELGNGARRNRATPTSTGILNAVGISGGYINGQRCAVLKSGEVDCWGYDAATGHGSSRPRPVSGISDAREVSVSGAHACAVRASREVLCWGMNGYGQLADGTTQTSATPVSTGISDATAVSVAERYACALLRNGGIKCWGDNHEGELGNGTEDSSLRPVTVKIKGATAVSAGYHTACATLASGGVDCWGSNDYGAAGNGISPSQQKHFLIPTPVRFNPSPRGQLHRRRVRRSGSR
jgi:alpha-tubulin suppressor-like RCC1 family protein